MNRIEMPSQSPNVRVGVAALVVNPDGKILVGSRKGSHGSGETETPSSSIILGRDRPPANAQTGTIQLPGGHLEFGEDITTCAARETLEETGLVVRPSPKVAAVTNDVFEKEGKHYITLFVWCDMADPSAVPEVRLPIPCLHHLRDSSVSGWTC